MPTTTTATDPTGGIDDRSIPPSSQPATGTPPTGTSSASEPGVIESIRHLAETGKALAAAEADRAKVKARYLLAAGQRIALFAVAGLVVGIALVVTLFVGLMLCLAPSIGMGLALLVTAIVALFVLGLLAMAIMNQVKRIRSMPS